MCVCYVSALCSHTGEFTKVFQIRPRIILEISRKRAMDTLDLGMSSMKMKMSAVSNTLKRGGEQQGTLGACMVNSCREKVAGVLF